MSFFDVLERRVNAINSLLCVGLDPHISELEALAELEQKSINSTTDLSQLALEFCKRIIDATEHVAAAYKPNAAFFEALGPKGVDVLNTVVQELIPKDIPCILDAKRGDISTTAEAYAYAAFEQTKADAITLHPYMGFDSVEPFIQKYKSKGCFILCKTSNPTSNDFQTLRTIQGEMVYEVIARKCANWNQSYSNSIGIVVGSTDIEALKRTRSLAPNIWILAPGVGFQGGDLVKAAESGLRLDNSGLLIPVSRGISRASDPRKAAEEMRDQLNACRTKRSTLNREGTIMDYQVKFFNLAVDSGVLKFGSFSLKSGRVSPYFFNAGSFDSGTSLAVLAECYAETIKHNKVEFDVIFGPAYKGIPLASAVAVVLRNSHNVDVGVAYNRKEVKDHGEGGLFVGCPLSNRKVIILDDVITAGTAIRESIDLLTAAGAKVVGAVVALDRQEKSTESSQESAIQAVEKEFGFRVYSIAGLSHLMEYIRASSQFDHDLFLAVDQYRRKYGVA